MQPRSATTSAPYTSHTDEHAAGADAIGATAYTLGGDIVFGSGRWAPHTTGGRRLLAHELAHVVQQRGLPHPTSAPVGEPDTAHEHDARIAADATVTGGPARVRSSPSRRSSSATDRRSATSRCPLPGRPPGRRRSPSRSTISSAPSSSTS